MGDNLIESLDVPKFDEEKTPAPHLNESQDLFVDDENAKKPDGNDGDCNNAAQSQSLLPTCRTPARPTQGMKAPRAKYLVGRKSHVRIVRRSIAKPFSRQLYLCQGRHCPRHRLQRLHRSHCGTYYIDLYTYLSTYSYELYIAAEPRPRLQREPRLGRPSCRGLHHR